MTYKIFKFKKIFTIFMLLSLITALYSSVFTTYAQTPPSDYIYVTHKKISNMPSGYDYVVKNFRTFFKESGFSINTWDAEEERYIDKIHLYVYIPKNSNSSRYDPTTIDIILNASDGKDSGTQITNYYNGDSNSSGGEIYEITFSNLHKDVNYYFTFRGSAMNSDVSHLFKSKLFVSYK